MTRHPVLKAFRRQFTTGLIILIPVITTIFLVTWLFRALDQILGRHLARFFGEYIYGVGFLSLFLLIWLVGLVGRTYFGGKLNNFKDILLARIPLIGTIFNSIKKVSDGLLEMEAGNFEQVVIIEYPRKGLYAVGFVTSREPADLFLAKESSAGKQVAHVFIPTVPNPTSGYILLVPEDELQRLDLSVEEGLKLVLSLGMIHPEDYVVSRQVAAARIKAPPEDKSPFPEDSQKNSNPD
ncbi:MAG TPA: DUF502 domain-containing protein [archaeon]|nr:DUF502 domain-containing protein [archaeon]